MRKPHRSEVREQVERLCLFLGLSKAAVKFVRFTAGEALSGRTHLNAYTVATAGIGYGEDYDPVVRGDVRVLASRVRQRIQKYYESVGVDDEVIIEYPRGYIPVFRMRSAIQAEIQARRRRFDELVDGLAAATEPAEREQIKLSLVELTFGSAA